MMPLLRTITLNRAGAVQVRVAGTRHCGVASAVVNGAVQVKYTIRLVVDANGLDRSGFLVDQEKLHDVMVQFGQDPVPWREPCELLTYMWGERLLEWISTANMQCTIQELDLTLSPMPHLGSFTAHFSQYQSTQAIQLVRQSPN